MICIEFLILRAPMDSAAVAVSILADALENMEKPTDLIGYWVLRHKTIPGDVALMLQWRVEIESSGSTLGLQLKPVLSEHGIVDHAIWIVENN